MTENLLFERYQLVRPLGEGGFAKTYLAQDGQEKDVLCVIKHLTLPGSSTPLTLANSSPPFLETARRLFKAEAAALRQLGTHDRIPKLLDAFESQGEFYLVQEYIDGESLSEVFQRQPLWQESQVVELLQEVLPILAFIHVQHVIHRDVKPSNLMRRRTDGKLMLIDFGAVKEITTQVNPDGSDRFTVSVGTQGYSAPEQLAGRPRYSSDLYSLGMTVVRGLTGRSPTELAENPQTGELLWETEVPDVSPGLKLFLRRLTHASIYQRYASATAALEDLNNLETLSAAHKADFPQTTLHLPTPVPESKGATKSPWRWLRGAIAPSLVTLIVLSIRQVGGWMPFELLVYDEWIQRQADLGPDERLLLVEITEADLRALQRSTPSDAVLSQAIQTLQAHDPRVIGLDLYRDIPQGEGHAELLETLKADNVVTIRKLGMRPSEAIPAPKVMPPDQVGFNDFPIDSDGVVRRNLLFASTDDRPDGEVFYSFGLRLALAYLEPQDILPLQSDLNPDYLALNDTTLVPLNANFGGYHRADDAGYQLMLQYRSPQNALPRLSLSELLAGQFTEDMIRDRLVIIGTTAPSAKDLFYTPYSEAAQEDFLMPGVILHAHAVSQILRVAFEEETLPWALPEAAELAWIVLAAGSGSLIGWRVRQSWVLFLGLVGGSLVMIGIPAVAFVANGWLPLLPAAVAFVGCAIANALVRSSMQPSSNDGVIPSIGGLWSPPMQK
ncbi:CHASE2 domain-containing protein [Oscillatoria sp. CS-180]|uniref:CHASE2 domain-containing protein n=1 Tax=Oscillatoria sp. CS-180 TaxID=3021720 RepID=UPI00232ADF6D|nr:CHASE2 domain-containing protein [Oscillatoria sp. CS-180]MDB9527695.1 CHASE2 domain-containing protein [Oscillatoria sp. CS-180]